MGNDEDNQDLDYQVEGSVCVNGESLHRFLGCVIESLESYLLSVFGKSSQERARLYRVPAFAATTAQRMVLSFPQDSSVVLQFYEVGRPALPQAQARYKVRHPIPLAQRKGLQWSYGSVVKCPDPVDENWLSRWHTVFCRLAGACWFDANTVLGVTELFALL